MRRAAPSSSAIWRGAAQGIAERHEFKFVHHDGGEVWTSMATNPIFDGAGAYIGALALVTDITDRRASTELIWQQANFDELTGLPNRHMFMDRLRQEVKKADRGGAFLALVFLDLDHFKEVNDQLGHAMGDALLVEAARRIAALRARVRHGGAPGRRRIHRDPGRDGPCRQRRAHRARRWWRRWRGRSICSGERVFVSASAGMALYPPDASNIGDLLANADQAMYAAKKAGRNRFSYFTPDLQEAAQARQTSPPTCARRSRRSSSSWSTSHHRAWPPARCKAEALLRWRHPTRGLLGPAEFIPFAESSGLIVEIGDWVFREAASQVQQWQQTIHSGFQVSVNQSPVQFRRDAALYLGWLDYLAELGLSPGSIVIEITESVLLEGADKVIERLRQYREMGLQVALENFGTGYSSLSHLKRFGIDLVKLDQSFIATLDDDSGDLAMCEAMIAMAHKLGLRVVAEGVETERQLRCWRLGCDFAQGSVRAADAGVANGALAREGAMRPAPMMM